MLVGYDVSLPQGKAYTNQVRLVDDKGAENAFQLAAVKLHQDRSIKSCRVHFYAELTPGGSYRYRLENGRPATHGKQGVTSRLRGDRLEVSSPRLAVELPAPGSKKYKTPIPGDQAPPPILRFRMSNGKWAGKGGLQTKRKVTAFSQQVVAQGPLFHETAYRIDFAPGGRYTVRVRVEKELSLVHISEEFDMGAALPNENRFVLELNAGWDPKKAVWSSYAKPDRATQLAGKCHFHGVGCWEQALDFSKPGVHVGLSNFQDFGRGATWYGLTGPDKTSPYVGVMSQHSGAWRLSRPAAGDIQWTARKTVELRLPLNPYLQGQPMNPFSTAEIDPDLPPTLGRRHWALVLESRPTKEDGAFDTAPHYLYRRYYGSLNLDDYKDFILDWPDAQKRYPRLLGTPKSIARLKANLDRCPDGEKLKRNYLISGSDKDAKSALASAMRGATWRLSALDCHVAHFRQFQNDMRFLFTVDTALAWPELPAEARKKLRAKMAILAYMLTNADFLPRGAGVHLGNPNMAINRTMGITLYGRMLPDHPMAKKWLDDASEYLKWSISHDVTPAGGQFRECPGYATYGPTVFLTVAAAAMRDAGYDLDKFDSLKDMGRWFIDIATPSTHPRGWAKSGGQVKEVREEGIKGRKMRVLPGFGNGRDIPGGQVEMLLAGLFAKSDPDLASRLMGSFHESGGFLGTEARDPRMWFYWNPDIKPVTPKYTDKVITGFGGVLRAHQGDQEFCAGLRQGYMQSHWNPDQGDFVLYARGRCIAPPTGWCYNPAPKGMNHDSLIAFGEPLAGHEHGRVDTFIRDYGFTPSLGYLGGVQTYKRNLGKKLDAPFDWHRQILMVRNRKVTSPNYVLMRDTMRGEKLHPSWWYQWLNTKAESITPIPGGVRASFPEKIMLDILFLHAKRVKTELLQGKFNYSFHEDYCQLKTHRAAGEDYFVLFYPYKAGEAPPESAELLAPGVARIITSESKDYVFASTDKPVKWKNDRVSLEGYAGMVRVKDKIAQLVNASAQPATLRYGKAEKTGPGPWEAKTQIDSTVDVVRAPIRKSPGKPVGKNVAAVGPAVKTDDPKVHSENITGWVAVDGQTVTLVATGGLGTIGYKDFYVKGEAPFTCIWKPREITLEAKGRRRVFVMPIPENLVPTNLLPPKGSLPESTLKNMTVNGWINWPWAPSMEINGVIVQGGWFDGVMAVGLDRRQSKAIIRPYTNPPVWKQNATTRLLPTPTE
jgi:hypothetical protein